MGNYLVAEPLQQAVNAVCRTQQEYFEKAAIELGENESITPYVVWFCYILGGWKALLSTHIPDGCYYEVTFNKEKNEAYVDTYQKHENVAIPLEDLL